MKIPSCGSNQNITHAYLMIGESILPFRILLTPIEFLMDSVACWLNWEMKADSESLLGFWSKVPRSNLKEKNTVDSKYHSIMSIIVSSRQCVYFCYVKSFEQLHLIILT